MSDALCQIAEHIWLFPTDKGADAVQPNVGIITTDGGTVLVDAGNSPRHARQITRALADLNAPLASRVIYTHHHWDHVFGAQIFVAPTIAHESCREILLERAARPWSAAYAEEEMRRNPAQEVMYTNILRAVDDWHGFQIVVPSLTFSKGMTLHLDALALEIEHVGGQHAPDSCIVKIRSAGVAFLGDCYYPPVLAERRTDSTYDFNMIRRLLADETLHTFIDGHTPTPISRDELARLLERELP
jgi:glyoxylase-like metal-dependent hydrolase (beta-lactamase superfamily II)